MNKELFKSKMNDPKIPSILDNSYLKNVINKSIQSTPPFNGKQGMVNLVITMEELSELQKEVSKGIRGKGNKLDIIEEMADVMISIEYIKSIYNINDKEIQKAMNIKLDRLSENIKSN